MLLATLYAAPLCLLYAVQRRLLPSRRDAFYQGLSQHVATIPGRFGVQLRAAFYSRTLRRCAPDVSIGFATIFATPDIEIGERVVIGPFGNIAHCIIEQDVRLGARVTVLGGRQQHGTARLDVPMRVQPGTIATVRIGAHAVLETGAIVAADIGERTVVQAGAVVVRPYGPDLVLTGSPTRLAEGSDA